jgi:hypothetical protein
MNEQIDPLDDTSSLHENSIGSPMQEAQSDFKKPIRRSLKKESVTTLSLTSSTCRWPFGDPAEPDFHYCGQLSQAKGPYCDTHQAMSRPPGQHRNRVGLHNGAATLARGRAS